MARELGLQDFSEYGIQISGDEMENGELRFRLSSASSSYIRTESIGSTGWQRSHYHSEQTEFFLIEKGEAEVATVENGKVVILRYGGGDTFHVDPRVPHNMRLSENGITHTVKYGGSPDWIAYPQLDDYLRTEPE